MGKIGARRLSALRGQYSAGAAIAPLALGKAWLEFCRVAMKVQYL